MKIFLWFLFLLLCFNTINAQQYYDSLNCSSTTNNIPGSRYTCNPYPLKNACHTFIVYRTNQIFDTLTKIAQLLNLDATELLGWNNIESCEYVLEQGQEVIVPIRCTCTEGRHFQANFSYMVPANTTLSDIACYIFDGLLSTQTLFEENMLQAGSDNVSVPVQAGINLSVPVKCACPDNVSDPSDVRYLVTYPVIEGDQIATISKKFDIPSLDLSVSNRFNMWQTIYPRTTVLVPLKSKPNISFNNPNSQPPPTPGFLPTITIEAADSTKFRNIYISVSVVGFVLILVALFCFGLYIKALQKGKKNFSPVSKLLSFNTRSSQLSNSTTRSTSPRHTPAMSSANSCLSPDLLAEIKFSLRYYSITEIKKATKDFSEESKIGYEMYKGSIDDKAVMIKQTRFEDTRLVIDIHSRINHINIVNLLGVCYGENDFAMSYLIFELPTNGCLRDCLSNQTNITLRWHKRTQIAVDIATGLHYLHYCIFPTFAHTSVKSTNIFLTGNFRAKLANVKTNPNPVMGPSQGTEIIEPEHILSGSASEKVDIFAFGIVLLELMSGQVEEDSNGKLLKDSIGFLGSNSSSEGGCFDQLKSFMDPCLIEDYPLAEALCVAVLAKACLEDDPLRRPSTHDVLKVLARMV